MSLLPSVAALLLLVAAAFALNVDAPVWRNDDDDDEFTEDEHTLQ